MAIDVACRDCVCDRIAVLVRSCVPCELAQQQSDGTLPKLPGQVRHILIIVHGAYNQRSLNTNAALLSSPLLLLSSYLTALVLFLCGVVLYAGWHGMAAVASPQSD